MDGGDGAKSTPMETKMTKTEYLTDNRSYLGGDQVSLIETLTDAQFAALQSLTARMGNADPGIDNTIVKSHETLADFDASRLAHWRERGQREETAAAGFTAVIYSDFQMIKSQPRRSTMAVAQFDGFTISLV